MVPLDILGKPAVRFETGSNTSATGLCCNASTLILHRPRQLHSFPTTKSLLGAVDDHFFSPSTLSFQPQFPSPTLTFSALQLHRPSLRFAAPSNPASGARAGRE